MPYFVAVSPPTGKASRPGASYEHHCLLGSKASHVRVSWSWPSRLFRIANTPALPKTDGPFWVVVDGFPEPEAISPASQSDSDHHRFEIRESVDESTRIQLIEYSSLDRLIAFTTVLIAIRAPFMRLRRDAGGRRIAYYRCVRRQALASSSSFELAMAPPRDATENEEYLATTFSNLRSPSRDTPFQDVQEIGVGEQLTLSYAGASNRHFHTTDIATGPDAQSPTESADLLREALRTSVAEMLEPGINAVMLSGGLDSGPVAAIARSVAVQSEKRIIATSWRLPEFPEADESLWIEKLANALDLEVKWIDGSRFLPFSDLGAAQVSPDLPIYNAFRPLILEVYRCAATLDARTILNASGGDKIYPRRQWVLDDAVRRRDIRGAFGEVRGIIRDYGILRFPFSSAVRYAARRRLGRWKRSDRRAPWLASGAPPARSSTPAMDSVARVGCSRDLFEQLLWSCRGTALENSFSNRFSLDRRDPFTHPDILDTAGRIPFRFNFRDAYDKWIMREATRGLLPDPIRLKERTGELTSFFDAGFRRNRREIRELLLDQRDEWANWFDREYIDSALQQDTDSEAAPKLVVGACLGYTLWKSHQRS